MGRDQELKELAFSLYPFSFFLYSPFNVLFQDQVSIISGPSAAAKICQGAGRPRGSKYVLKYCVQKNIGGGGPKIIWNLNVNRKYSTYRDGLINALEMIKQIRSHRNNKIYDIIILQHFSLSSHPGRSDLPFSKYMNK